jgi:hypothetical protein
MGAALIGAYVTFDSDGRCTIEGRASHMNRKRDVIYGRVSLQLELSYTKSNFRPPSPTILDADQLKNS